MITAATVLLICALICWALAAFNVPIPAPVSVGWLGVFLWGIAQLVR